MTREQYLLIQLMSECNEVAHRASKILHFGLHEKQAGQTKTNFNRLHDELVDLEATIEMCHSEGILNQHDLSYSEKLEKKHKVEKHMKYSREQGILEE